MHQNNQFIRITSMKSISHYDDVPAQLRMRIMQELVRRQRNNLILQRVFAAGAVMGSLTTCGVAVSVLLTNFFQSGAGEFISIAYSDTNVLFQHSAEFMSLMLETLPLLSLASVLAALAFVILSIWYAVREYRIQSFITVRHYA